MKPSLALCGRIRFTTKEVARGFYRGNRTGAMGAHTEWGGYVIDYRKVRHYNVPDLTDFSLTPFVAKGINPKSTLPKRPDGITHYEPKKVDGEEYIRQWSLENPDEYDHLWAQERQRIQIKQQQTQQIQPEQPHEETQQELEEEFEPPHGQLHEPEQVRIATTERTERTP